MKSFIGAILLSLVLIYSVTQLAEAHPRTHDEFVSEWNGEGLRVYKTYAKCVTAPPRGTSSYIEIWLSRRALNRDGVAYRNSFAHIHKIFRGSNNDGTRNTWMLEQPRYEIKTKGWVHTMALISGAETEFLHRKPAFHHVQLDLSVKFMDSFISTKSMLVYWGSGSSKGKTIVELENPEEIVDCFNL
jgi:hypothetical protein